MPVFAWRQRKTKHFGDQWVPFAEIHLRATTGRWYTFSVQVDTGAVISVLTRSAADLLKIRYCETEPISLSGIDAPGRMYRVHKVPARIGDTATLSMRIAFSEHEDVPNLLGRLDVLDNHQIDFDASLLETCIRDVWLDDDLRRIWRCVLDTQATILDRWQDQPLPGRADEAARRFVNRADQLVAAAMGLLKLQRDFELPLILRSLLELAIQFEYLMLEPEPRADLYLDFEHVTKYTAEQALLKGPGELGDRLRSSALRQEGGARILREYERVRPTFASKRGTGSVRKHWYPGTLKDIAAQVGRSHEYDSVYGIYSAWAHGDAWAAEYVSRYHGGFLHPFVYWARILTGIADAKQIILTGDAYESLSQLARGWD